eukprot:COSAG01_NODE_2507_length_7552_cov_56.408560_11_plen_314_part_00
MMLRRRWSLRRRVLCAGPVGYALKQRVAALLCLAGRQGFRWHLRAVAARDHGRQHRVPMVSHRRRLAARHWPCVCTPLAPPRAAVAALEPDRHAAGPKKARRAHPERRGRSAGPRRYPPLHTVGEGSGLSAFSTERSEHARQHGADTHPCHHMPAARHACSIALAGRQSRARPARRHALIGAATIGSAATPTAAAAAAAAAAWETLRAAEDARADLQAGARGRRDARHPTRLRAEVRSPSRRPGLAAWGWLPVPVRGCAAITVLGPPKIDLGVCVGMFCGACMYVGGVGQKELHCAPPLQRTMSLDEFGNGYI